MLLEHGAALSAKAKDGASALDAAMLARQMLYAQHADWDQASQDALDAKPDRETTKKAGSRSRVRGALSGSGAANASNPNAQRQQKPGRMREEWDDAVWVLEQAQLVRADHRPRWAAFHLHRPRALRYPDAALYLPAACPMAPATPFCCGDLTASSATLPLAFQCHPPLPQGMSICVDSGTISGCPTVPSPPQLFAITVDPASQLAGSPAESATISIAITCPAPLSIPYPSSGFSFLVGVPISPSSCLPRWPAPEHCDLTPPDQPPTVGPRLVNHLYGPLSWTISPRLPASLTIDPRTGEIAGHAIAAFPPTTYTVTATNASSEVSTAIISLSALPPIEDM